MSYINEDPKNLSIRFFETQRLRLTLDVSLLECSVEIWGVVADIAPMHWKFLVDVSSSNQASILFHIVIQGCDRDLDRDDRLCPAVSVSQAMNSEFVKGTHARFGRFMTAGLIVVASIPAELFGPAFDFGAIAFDLDMITC